MVVLREEREETAVCRVASEAVEESAVESWEVERVQDREEMAAAVGVDVLVRACTWWVVALGVWPRRHRFPEHY